MVKQKHYLIAFGATLLTTLNITAQEGFSFLANSDMQVGNETTEQNKAGHVQAMINLINNKSLNVKAALLPGDLIEGIVSPANISKKLSQGKKTKENLLKLKQQFTEFKESWLTPLEKAFKDRWPQENKEHIYLTAGNHESYDFNTNIVNDFIKKRHNSLYYSFDINGVHFCCLGVVPDTGIKNWLKKDLEENKTKPTVIFFHYNLRGRDRARWWTDNDRNNFYNIIKPYLSNIKLIINGHAHYSFTSTYKGIPIYGVGGKEFALFTFSFSPITITQKHPFTGDKKTISTTKTSFKVTYYKAVNNKPVETIVAKEEDKGVKSIPEIKKTAERGFNWELVRRR